MQIIDMKSISYILLKRHRTLIMVLVISFFLNFNCFSQTSILPFIYLPIFHNFQLVITVPSAAKREDRKDDGALSLSWIATPRLHHGQTPPERISRP